jgi:hypothetical protein
MTINKGFLFNEPDGFPLNQQRLEWMQEAYSAIFDGFAAMIGDNVIMSGCIVAGNTVSDGWLVIDGALYPFKGTAAGIQASIIIRETKTPLTFKNGQQKEVQFYKYAEFGTGAGSIAWNTLIRLSSLKDISEHLKRTDDPHNVTKDQVGLGNLPNAKTDDINVSDSNILATSKMVNNSIINSATYFTRNLTAADYARDNEITPSIAELYAIKTGRHVVLKYRFFIQQLPQEAANLTFMLPAELGEIDDHDWWGTGFTVKHQSSDVAVKEPTLVGCTEYTYSPDGNETITIRRFIIQGITSEQSTSQEIRVVIHAMLKE